MKRVLFLLLLCALVLAGCSGRENTVSSGDLVAGELLPRGSYTLTSTGLGNLSLGEELFPSGTHLFFRGEEPGSLKALNWQTMSLFTTAVYPLTGEMETAGLLGLFPGEADSLWVAEQVTRQELSPVLPPEDVPVPPEDVPDPVNEEIPEPEPEYIQRVVSRLRRLNPLGEELASFEPEESLAGFVCGAQQGQYLALSLEDRILIYHVDGTLLAILRPQSRVFALIRYRDGLAALLQGEYGRVALLPISLDDFSAGETATLPFQSATLALGEDGILPVSGVGTNLYFPCQGNLFACDAASGQVFKMADWLDFDLNPVYIVFQQMQEDGSILALYREGSGTQLFLRLTPGEQKKSECSLTMAMLSTDLCALDLVVNYNKANPEARLRIANFGEYAAFGLTAQAALRQQLSQQKIPDLIFNSNRDLPVTELAAGYLEDLYPYLKADSQLQKEGIFRSVLTVQEEEGKLLSISPKFVLSTAISTKSMVGTGTLTVTRAMNLYALYGGKDGAALENFLRQETVLREHISRNSLRYGLAEQADFSFNNSSFQEGLLYAALFPRTIDINQYGDEGPAPGWARVRTGEQLLLTGQYYNFSALSQDLYAVGDDAVICGFPDVAGNHVLELWETYGMLAAGSNKEQAWQFLRTVLLAESQSTISSFGFPVNRVAFAEEAKKELALSGTRTLSYGDQVLQIPAQLSTGQYSMILAAVEDAVARYESDAEVFAAVWKEAQKYFDGTQDLSTTVSNAQTAAENYRNLAYN